mgnify:CR=1 FL=1
MVRTISKQHDKNNITPRVSKLQTARLQHKRFKQQLIHTTDLHLSPRNPSNPYSVLARCKYSRDSGWGGQVLLFMVVILIESRMRPRSSLSSRCSSSRESTRKVINFGKETTDSHRPPHQLVHNILL